MDRPSSRMRIIPRIKVSMVKEADVVFCANPIRTPSQVETLVRDFIGPSDREHFIVVHLSTRHIVTAIETISIGTISASLVHPREVFKSAIVKSSAGIIVAHNHPSGNVNPSEEDLSITRRLVEVGELIGVEVLDHVIVGGESDTYSMRENGQI